MKTAEELLIIKFALGFLRGTIGLEDRDMEIIFNHENLKNLDDMVGLLVATPPAKEWTEERHKLIADKIKEYHKLILKRTNSSIPLEAYAICFGWINACGIMHLSPEEVMRLDDVIMTSEEKKLFYLNVLLEEEPPLEAIKAITTKTADFVDRLLLHKQVEGIMRN